MVKNLLLRVGDVFVLEGHPYFEAGAYVVDKTAMVGGGTGHGPHDTYPDGWEVTALLLKDQEKEISFFQSGCFNGMLPDIEPIGRAKRTWNVVGSLGTRP